MNVAFMIMNNKNILSGLRPQELETVVKELGLPRFTAKQIASWLYQKRVFSFDEMTNLSKKARELLNSHYSLGRTKPVKEARSKDGTIKYLFQTLSGHFIETVYIPETVSKSLSPSPDNSVRNRATLCISSQVGCKMGCRFCMTGRQGFEGNLTVADILNQVYSIPQSEKLTNIVVMGQGEPFDNTDAILRALEILTADYGLAWSPKRITVSTVGLIPGMERFIRESKANLAVSLHFAFPDDRAANMPAQKAFPIQSVVDTLKKYDFCRRHEANEVREEAHQRRLSFEYIVFDGLNDQPHHLDKLVRLLRPLDCRVNLIPFNTVPIKESATYNNNEDVQNDNDDVQGNNDDVRGNNDDVQGNNEDVQTSNSAMPVLISPTTGLPYRGAPTEKMMRIRNYLTSKGLFTTLRASRGQDIEAACGLLSTKEIQRRR